jgi:phosphoribosylformimino-5-aminoimidazole carboxamide ribotide isomerase
LNIGISTIIVGTLAAKSPDIVNGMLERFPGSVAIGIDARSGLVAVEGWTESTRLEAAQLAKNFQAMRPTAFIYTDIERDGMMRGPNIDATRDFAETTSIPVILSGGISSLEDVKKALPLAKSGVEGIIIGRALYEGAIDLEAALKLVETTDAS